MKRLPISSDERLFLKSIETNAMVVLLMFKIYPHPLNSDALAFEMKWDNRKAKKMLDELSSDGFTALMKGQGYVLTSQACSMVVQFFGNLISLPLEAQALAQGKQDQAQQVLEGSVVETNSTHGARALVVGESLTKDLKTDTTTPPESARNVRMPTTAQIIAATPILFGEPGVVSGKLDVDEINPLEALGVLAHCYAMRKTTSNPGGLYKPAGLAYKMLEDGKSPRPAYKSDPLKYLPEDFLEVLGLIDYPCSCGEIFYKRNDFDAHQAVLLSCEDCDERFHSADALDGHRVAQHPIAESAAMQVIGMDDPGYRAWIQVQEQLRMEMPRVSFETWVRDSQVVHFDGQVLSVGVRNAYTCDWLESRLQSTVDRLLIGILKSSVTVKFVVADGV